MNKKAEMKRIWKRALSLLLAICIVAGMVPTVVVSADAASVGGDGWTSDGGYLTASYEMTSNGTPKGSTTASNIDGITRSLSMTAQGSTLNILIKKWDYYTQNELTIQSPSDAANSIALFFTVEGADSGGIELFTIKDSDGNTVSAENKSYSFQIDPGESCVLTLKSKSGEDNNASVNLVNISSKVLKDTYTVVFGALGNGTITVPGRTDTDEYEKNSSLSISATANNGSKFVAWVDADNVLLDSAATTTYICLDDRTVNALFVSNNTAVFQVRSSKKVYTDLQSAIDGCASTDTIVLLTSGTLTGGPYTIPSGVTLLLPYAAGATSITDSSKLPYAYSSASGNANAISAPGDASTYLTLTLDGATINVGAGAVLALGGQYTSSSSGMSGATYGAHSDIKMTEGAVINVTNGGILSCVGYIYGDDVLNEDGSYSQTGQINLVEGGKGYEPFVVTDFHGGTYSAVISQTNKCSPFNSFAMMNIQCDMHMDASSYLYGYADMYAGSKHNTTTPLVIGPSNAVLILSSGTIDFSYDKEAAPDSSLHAKIGKATVKINGTAVVSEMSLTVQTGVTIKTGDYYFPIAYNFDVTLESGTLNVDEKVKVLPGAKVTVCEGAELVIPSGSTLLVYDAFAKNQYGSGHLYYPQPAELVAGGLAQRPHLIVDGKMTIKGAFAGIVETNGTGVVDATAAQTLGVTGYAEGVSAGERYILYSIPDGVNTKSTYTVPARLVNYRYDGTNGQYLTMGKHVYYAASGEVKVQVTEVAYTDQTSGTPVDTTLRFEEPENLTGSWVETGFAAIFDLNGGTVPEGTDTVQEGLAPGSAITEPTFTVTKTGYEFKGWSFTKNGTDEVDFSTYEMSDTDLRDVTLYAMWEAESYSVTLKDGDNTIDQLSSYKYGVGATLPTKEQMSKTGYDFAGWYTSEDFSGESVTSISVTDLGNKTFYAKWTPKSYTVTWVVDGETVKTETIAYGDAVTEPVKPSKGGYDFSGWEAVDEAGKTVDVPETMPAYNVTITAKWQGKTLTVSLEGGDADKLDTDSFSVIVGGT